MMDNTAINTFNRYKAVCESTVHFATKNEAIITTFEIFGDEENYRETIAKRNRKNILPK